jgi:integrase
MLAQPPYCSPCHQWRSKKYHQPGACRRCGRAWLVNADGLCPPCITEIQQSDAAWYFSPAPAPRPVQLAFILPGLRLPHRMPFGSYRARSDGRFHPPPWARAQLPAEGLDDPRFCPPVMARQLPLFGPRRTLVVADARKIRDRVLAGWDQAEPVLAAYAAEHEYGQAWQQTMSAVLRLALAVREADGKLLVDDAVLDVLPRFSRADAPFHETDVRAMAGLRRSVQVRRVLTFLAARDMLIPDPGRQAEPRQHAVDRLLASLPGQIGREASAWVTVMRGHGRVRHPALAYKTIRNYLAYLMPVLTGWASQYTSLREVTRHDILDAVDARRGPVIQHRIVALRSPFRALRQERVIFHDPTRGISLPAPARLPQPLPAARVAGLLDRADGPAARLVVALIAIHAVPEADLVRLQAADLDLAAGTLTIRHGYRHRIVYLDEVTAALASQWLRYRHQRWPGSRNPHLLVSQQTAADVSPVGPTMIGAMFEPLGVRPVRLRQDRILDEARHTADPVRLVRLFGISGATAMKYVFTAHPERQAGLPR